MTEDPRVAESVTTQPLPEWYVARALNDVRSRGMRETEPTREQDRDANVAVSPPKERFEPLDSGGTEGT